MIIILGAGSHAQEVFSIIWAQGLPFGGFVDETLTEPKILYGYPVMTTIPDTEVRFIVGVGNPVIKDKLEQKVLDRLAPPIYKGSGYSCQMEDGVVVGLNTTITIDVEVGRSTSINSNCVISHGCRIGKRCHISGGSILSGNVVLEDEVYLGCGVNIIPNIRVGKGAIIGAGAVVIRDVEPYTIVAGCPARVLRTYKRGEKVI